jgi:hypothetical protein
LTDLEAIRFRNNGITDEGAALLLKACSLCPNFKSFVFEKNEINKEFVNMLYEVIGDGKEYLIFLIS